MGFRKRESDQSGFGIQSNRKTKASTSKPRKKTKKKAVAKQQGNPLEPMTEEQYQEALRAISAATDEPIKSKVEFKIEDRLARGKNIPPRLLRKLDRIEAARAKLAGEELSLLEQASQYGPRKASNIVASGVSGDDIVMTNQQAQDQFQTLTNEQIAMLQAQAIADAQAAAIAEGGDALSIAEGGDAISRPVVIVETPGTAPLPPMPRPTPPPPPGRVPLPPMPSSTGNLKAGGRMPKRKGKKMNKGKYNRYGR